jgi:hypothetical protein
MKKTIVPLLCSMLFALLLNACNKDVKESAESTQIDDATLGLIKARGFSTNGAQKIPEGFLVEGDVVLTEADLHTAPTSPFLVIAKEEQYRTNNLVNPATYPVIKVAVSGTVSTAFSNAVNAAIARYNAENLRIQFQRVATGADIVIRIVNTGQYIASAGFPTSNGAPYNEVKYAKKYSNYGEAFMTTVLAHEVGHCIGFRHTDYMNRAYSCGSGGSEGASTVGAIHIEGTPTGPDPNSWMLACLSSTTNRPFNANDKKALALLY